MENKFIEIEKFFLINVSEIIRIEPVAFDKNSFRIVLRGENIIVCNDQNKYELIKRLVDWL